METDELFYELFQFDPSCLFKLIDLDLGDNYTFESITIKTTEKRLDGFFKSPDGELPNVFLEVQGYYDEMIYWRLFREISTYYEQRKDKVPFIAVVLFLDERYDPGKPFFSFESPNRLIRVYLENCLNNIGKETGSLTILKPLVFKENENLEQAVKEWKNEIYEMNLSLAHEKYLLDLLQYTIIQRFPKLTLKEIQKMIQLTPLEQTVAVQELIHMRTKEAESIGLEKGEIIGEIRMAQRIAKTSVSSKEELFQKNIEELQGLLHQLEGRLV